MLESGRQQLRDKAGSLSVFLEMMVLFSDGKIINDVNKINLTIQNTLNSPQLLEQTILELQNNKFINNEKSFADKFGVASLLYIDRL